MTSITNVTKGNVLSFTSQMGESYQTNNETQITNNSYIYRFGEPKSAITFFPNSNRLHPQGHTQMITHLINWFNKIFPNDNLTHIENDTLGNPSSPEKEN